MLNPDFHDMLSAFCAENVDFMLVGAYALAAHTRVRPAILTCGFIAQMKMRSGSGGRWNDLARHASISRGKTSKRRGSSFKLVLCPIALIF